MDEGWCCYSHNQILDVQNLRESLRVYEGWKASLDIGLTKIYVGDPDEPAVKGPKLMEALTFNTCQFSRLAAQVREIGG